MSLWLCISDSIRLCVCVAKCGGVWWRLMVSREAVRGVWLCRGVCVRVWGGWRSLASAGRCDVAVGCVCSCVGRVAKCSERREMRCSGWFRESGEDGMGT